MATQRKRQTKKPQGNAAQNKSSKAGKRSEQQPKAAGAGASSKPTTAKRKRGNKTEIDEQKRGLIERLIQALKYWLENKPDKFPFWARLKFGKNRTTLIIDEAEAYDKKKKRMVDGYVDREATHTPSKNTEEIRPNPDKDDPDPMNLKRPQKRPKRLYQPHNKKLDMPDKLKKRYEGNNKKGTKK